MAPRNKSLSFRSKISRLSLKSSKVAFDRAGSMLLVDLVEVVVNVNKQPTVVKTFKADMAPNEDAN